MPQNRHGMIDPPSLSTIAGIALILFTSSLGLVVHELGHALAAGAVGFRVRMVRVGRLAATGTPGGWQLRLLPQRIRGGWVWAHPLSPEHLRVRHALFVAGGPAAHLLLAGVVLAAAKEWGGAWVLAAVLLLLAVGLNLLPLGLRREGRWLDGDWLLAWSVRPRVATQRVALGELYQAIEAGQRPREWDENWTRHAALVDRRRASSQEVAGDLLAYSWAIDRGLVDDAGRWLSRAFSGRRLLPDDQCATVLIEAAFFVARHRGRRELAIRLLEAAPEPSTATGRADLERAHAALQLAAGERVESVAACDRALATLNTVEDVPSGLIEFDRDQVEALRDTALAGES
jgi:hypothetical protein